MMGAAQGAWAHQERCTLSRQTLAASVDLDGLSAAAAKHQSLTLLMNNTFQGVGEPHTVQPVTYTHTDTPATVEALITRFMRGETKQCHATAALGEYTIDIFGQWLPAITQAIPETFTPGTQEMLCTIKNAFLSERPFMTIKMRSLDQSHYAGCLALYTNKDGSLALFSSASKSLRSTHLYKRIVSSLSAANPSVIERQVRQSWFTNIINYLGPYLFFHAVLDARGHRLTAFISTLKSLSTLAPYSTISPSGLNDVLVEFGLPVPRLHSCYKLYMHYQSKGIDIVSLFNHTCATADGNALLGFIETCAMLKKVSPYPQLNAGDVERTLINLGVSVSHMSSLYKLYLHYKKNIPKKERVDIVSLFKKNLAVTPEKMLLAFIVTFDTLKTLPTCDQLNERNLEGVLAAFGIQTRRLHMSYKLYHHYAHALPENNRVDIVDLFSDNLRTAPRLPLPAFIATFDSLHDIAAYRHLKPGYLENVLTGFGIPVSFFGSFYNVYTRFKRHANRNKRIDMLDLFYEKLTRFPGNATRAAIATVDALRQRAPEIQFHPDTACGILRGFGIRVHNLAIHYSAYHSTQDPLIYSAA